MAQRTAVLTSLLFSFITALNVSGQSAAIAPHPIILHGARLLDVKTGRMIKPGEILVQGERIVEVGTSVKRPSGAEVIDLAMAHCCPDSLMPISIYSFIREPKICRRFRNRSRSAPSWPRLRRGTT